MITQQINTLKFIEQFAEYSYQLNDAYVLLLIFEHPDSSKSDLLEIAHGDRNVPRSSFDKPIQRLLDAGLIEYRVNEGASTRNGQGRGFYSITKSGQAFLKSCTHNNAA